MTSTLYKNLRIGELTLLEKEDNYHWIVLCSCGRLEYATNKRLMQNFRDNRGACVSCRTKQSPEYLAVGTWSSISDRHPEFVLNLMAACDPWRKR